MSELEWLELPEFAEITDTGIKELAKSKSLKHLRLLGPSRVSDAGLFALQHLQSLRLLQIDGLVSITMEAVEKFAAAVPECSVTFRGTTL